jgi:acyl carrier protein
MTRSEVTVANGLLDFGTFSDMLLAELGIPAGPLGAETNLVDDLAFDSVLTFELLLVVEDWIGVLLPEALLGQLKTLGDVYDIYRTRVTQ